MVYETKSEKHRKIKDGKVNTPLSILFDDCPDELRVYMEYCRGLGFEDEPDYDYILSIFNSLAKKEKINLNDGIFDWSVKATAISKFK